MNNVTFDSNSFSKELGVYDFFNVLLSGATFVCGLCIVSKDIKCLLWSELSFLKGLGLILLIYLLGMVMQDIGSLMDKHFFKIYQGMNQKILKGEIGHGFRSKTNNYIIKNPLVLTRYRSNADALLSEFNIKNDKNRFDNDFVNGYIFSVCQYYVSVTGKDKKVEKMRALFAMSKSLMACFFVLAAIMFLCVFTNTTPSVDIVGFLGLSSVDCAKCVTKVFLSISFAGMGFLFIVRAKRTMKNFLLILLGTYDAIVRSRENNVS